MQTLKQIAVLLAAMTVLAGCGKEKINSKGKTYCTVFTEAATNVTAMGATLHGRFEVVDLTVEETGFLFAKTADFNKETASKKEVDAENKTLELTLTNLEPKTSYSYMAYVVANDTKVYGSKVEFTTTGVSVTGITMSKPSATMTLSRENGAIAGNTLQLSASVSPSNASNKSVNWSSSNTNVATVSSTGLVTATGTEGKATITAAADGTSHSDKCEITVSKVKLTSVSVSGGGDFRMAFESTHAITVTTTPSNAYYTSISFSSSDRSVATVNDKGVVTGIDGGFVTITVKIDDVEKGSAKLCVIPGPPSSAIDLGVEGVKWAPYNLGAKSEGGKGFLYAKGRKSPSSDNTATGDAATYAWGGKWRTPTRDEMLELINKTWKWNGMTGWGYFTVSNNGNSIKFNCYTVVFGTYQDRFWTQTSVNSSYKYYLHLQSSSTVELLYGSDECYIRPVLQTF